MKHTKHIHFLIVFFLIISSAIALNKTMATKTIGTYTAPPDVSFVFNNKRGHGELEANSRADADRMGRGGDGTSDVGLGEHCRAGVSCGGRKFRTYRFFNNMFFPRRLLLLH